MLLSPRATVFDAYSRGLALHQPIFAARGVPLRPQRHNGTRCTTNNEKKWTATAPLLGTLRELLEQLLPPNEQDAPRADEPREEEDSPPPADALPADEPREAESQDAASDTDSVPDLASASSSSDSDEGPPPARRRPRMPALAPASSSDSESDGDAPELASASSSDDEAEAPPPRRAAAGPRVGRVGRHVLVVGGGPGEGRPDLGDRPARVRTCVEIKPVAVIRHVMTARPQPRQRHFHTGASAHGGHARRAMARTRALAPHVVAAFRAVDRAQFLPADARADAYIDSPARSGVFHQSSPSIYAAALEALDLGGARRRSFLNIGSGTGYFSALCAAAAAAAGGELSPHVGVERHAELVDWARTRTTTDPAARIRAELAAFSSSSLADHLADIAPYAAARGASSLAELAALPADTLDDMIASAGWSILKAATFRRHLARYHDEHAGRTWLPPRAPDVFYDVGDVFDVVEALRDAHSPLRGRFDRVYVGAGVDRSSCRVLLRLLAPDGLLVAPRDDRHGEAQRLVTAVRRGAGDAYAITAGARVAFASLVRPSGGGVASRAPALAGPVWGEARPGALPPAFRAAAATLARGVARGGGGARRACRGTPGARRSSRPSRRIGSSRARRRRRPAGVRSVRPAGAREVLLRRSGVLLAGLPARGVRRSCC